MKKVIVCLMALCLLCGSALAGEMDIFIGEYGLSNAIKDNAIVDLADYGFGNMTLKIEDGKAEMTFDGNILNYTCAMNGPALHMDCEQDEYDFDLYCPARGVLRGAWPIDGGIDLSFLIVEEEYEEEMIPEGYWGAWISDGVFCDQDCPRELMMIYHEIEMKIAPEMIIYANGEGSYEIMDFAMDGTMIAMDCQDAEIMLELMAEDLLRATILVDEYTLSYDMYR